MLVVGAAKTFVELFFELKKKLNRNIIQLTAGSWRGAPVSAGGGGGWWWWGEQLAGFLSLLKGKLAACRLYFFRQIDVEKHFGLASLSLLPGDPPLCISQFGFSSKSP